MTAAAKHDQGDAAAQPPRPGPAALYDAPGRLLKWSHTSSGGMTVDIGVSSVGAHPFDGLRIGREHGQRLQVDVGHHHDIDGDVLLYRGEAILLEWKDSGRTGKMVRALIDDGPDGAAGRHPFSHLPAGYVSGEPLLFRALAIDDDESVIPAGKLKRREPFHELSPVTQVHVLLTDARFRAFLRANAGRFVKDPGKVRGILMLADTPSAFGAAMTREMLGVPSRAVLSHDTDEGARARRIWKRVLQLWVGETHGLRL